MERILGKTLNELRHMQKLLNENQPIPMRYSLFNNQFIEL